jgi:hypothetical protein
LDDLINFDLLSIQLNKRQLKKVEKLSKDSAFRQSEQQLNFKRSHTRDQNGKYSDIFTKEQPIFHRIELNRTYDKYKKLYSLFPSYLEITRNNFLKKKFKLEMLELELKAEIVEEHRTQLRYGNIKHKLPKSYSQNEFKFWLINGEHEKTTQYLDLIQEISGIENNIDFVFGYLDKFLSTGNITYFQTAVNDLASCCNMSFKLVSDSGFKVGLRYYSRGKFCAFSRKVLVQDHKSLLINAIKYYQRYNKTYSFLTLSPKNIFDLNKNDLLDLGDVLKKFFNHKKIKEVYTGYFGVPEIVFKGKNEYNVHFHFMTMRHEDYHKGTIHHTELKTIFKSICDESPNTKLHGSFMVDIKAPQFNAPNPDKVLNKVANYILQYITKGIKINSHDARLNLIDSLDGIRMFRSGGDLAKNKLQQISIQNEFETQLDYFDDLPKVNNYISIGGNKTQPPVQFDTTQEEFISLKKKNYSNYAISQHFLLNGRSKTKLYQNIQKSMFSTSQITCPFTSEESGLGKVHFSGMSRFRGKSDIRHPLFAVDALQGLGLENESKSLLNSFNMDLSKIYENDLIGDLLALNY